jgi:uncharacterized membrane protein (UPF0127 family)
MLLFKSKIKRKSKRKSINKIRININIIMRNMKNKFNNTNNKRDTFTLIKETSYENKPENSYEDKYEDKYEELATVRFADSFFSRLFGLMFKKSIDYVLVLKPSSIGEKYSYFSSIHTLFMRFPIDIIYLNKEKEVLEIVRLDPWKFHRPKEGASYILETPAGNIAKWGVSVGDKLDFVCKN